MVGTFPRRIATLVGPNFYVIGLSAFNQLNICHA